jgi:hypothetical protein
MSCEGQKSGGELIKSAMACLGWCSVLGGAAVFLVSEQIFPDASGPENFFLNYPEICTLLVAVLGIVMMLPKGFSSDS